MRPFRRRRRGGVFAVFEPGEAHLLVSLSGQVVELLKDRSGTDAADDDPLARQIGLGGPSLPPEDPVLRRLLPDAYRDDADDAAEFRRFTERSLSSSKVNSAESLIGSLIDAGLGIADVDESEPIEVELDAEGVQAWLRSLNDIRLSLAVRLGIEDDDDLELLAHSGDDTIGAMTEIYHWLGYVQESLVDALD